MVRQVEGIPDRGDFVWITMDPQAGHEPAGRRPAVVLSPLSYNRAVGLALFCPVTRQMKGYRYEVSLPPGLPVSGVVLADEIKSLDWRARRAEVVGRVPEGVLVEVVQKLETLLP